MPGARADSMKRRALPVLVALLLALSCADSYPSVGGLWQYAASLTYPSDYNLAGGTAYVCTFRAPLTLTQNSNIFSGTYDSLSTSCNSGSSTTGGSGSVLNGAVTKDGILAFYFDSPSWVSIGTVHGDSMGGTVTDSVASESGLPEAASGTWVACQNRRCK